MVRVKTPSGWITVNPGESVGKVSVPSSDSSSDSSSSGSSSSSGGVSSRDPTINTNPDFPISSGGSSSSIVEKITERNTYNPSTGIYVDSSGQGSSMVKAPVGATIIRGTPTFNNGSSSSSGSSRQKITDAQISQIQEVNRQQNIQSQIATLDEQQKTTQILQQTGIVPLPVSSRNRINWQNIAEERKKSLEENRMSIAEPDLKNIDVSDLASRSSKNIWGKKGDDYVEPKVVEDIINKRSTQVLLEARDKEVGEAVTKQLNIKKQDIEDYVSLANISLNNYSNELQQDINSGKISVSEAEKSLESFQKNLNKNIEDYSNKKNEELKTIGTDLDKKWWEERGQYIDKAAGKIIGSYRTLNILEKANIPNVAIATAGGFAVGAGLGAGLGILGSVAGASTASSVGKGLAIGFGLLAVRSGGKAVYSLSKQYSAGEISKGEFVATIGTGAVFAGASIGGAMAGGLTVKAITNYGKLNAEEKAISERLLNRKNSIEVTNVKGSITESQINQLKISPTQKANLLKQLKVGNSVQKVKININKAGLTPQEIKVANKLNLRGTGYQVTSNVGKSVTGYSSYNIKTGRGLSRFNSQMTREVTSLFTGKSNKGNIAGLSVSEIRTPAKRNILRFGDRSSINQARLELIKGKGTVKYSKEGGNLIRYEYSKSSSKLLRADVYDSKGNWIKSNIKGQGGVSESLRVSKLYGEKGLLQGDLSTGRINTRTTTIFKDVAGKGITGKESPSFFEYKKVPSRSTTRFVDSTEISKVTDSGLLNIQKIVSPKIIPKVPAPQATLVSASKSTLFNAPAPAPTYVGGEGGLLSQSIYSNEGSFVSGQADAQFVPALTTKQDSLLTGKSMLASQAEIKTLDLQADKLYIEPKFKQLFVQPKAISKQLFQEPQAQQLFVQPQAQQIYLESQAISKQLFNQPITKQVSKLEASQLTQLNLLASQVTPATTTPPIGIPGGVGLFVLPPLGSPKTGGGQRGTRQRTKSSFLPEYNPSLGSVLTGQKAKEVTQKEFKLLSKKKYSGFESRSPLQIVNKKSSKKKKVKKRGLGLFG